MKHHLAQNIRALRQRTGLSQQGLADALSLNRSNIASYESGSAEPNASRLLSISRFFGVSLEALIDKDLSEKVDQADKLAAISTELSAFMQRTLAMRKVFSGLQEVYRYRQAKNQAIPEDLKYLVTEFENLSEIMEDLLKVNEDLLEQVKKKGDHTAKPEE